MNLRVDLMLETERRSPSLLNVKVLSRLSVVVVPLIIAVILGMVVMGSMGQRTKLSELEAQWKSLEPKKKAAEQMIGEVARNTHVLKALEGWPASRLTQHEQLLGIVQQVPEEIQLIAVNINQELKLSDRRVPTRVYAMSIEGRSVGANAEANIQVLVNRLKSAPPFAGNTQSVAMRGTTDTRAGASKTDRLFTITCVYAPRDFVP